MVRRTTLLVLAMASVALGQVGDVLGVHDPCIAEDHGVYYVYSTGRGLPIRESRDLYSWTRAGRAFDAVPAWARERIPRVTALWAPDLSFWNGKWHLYYAASSFGSDRSVIGLATNPTLDPKSPDYQWNDDGLVIESKGGTGWNAIDPDLALDEDNRPYLFFGSFWGGIKAVRIDPATGKPPAGAEPELIPVAARPDTHSHAIEAAFVFKHDGWYYLFVSFDQCCKGIDSTYNIRVGRSKSLLGPYRDMDDRNMSEGGGSLVLAGEQLLRGPGHNAAIHTRDRDYLACHTYDVNNSGQPILQIRQILWDHDGWPLPGPVLIGPPARSATTRPANDMASPAGTWLQYKGADQDPTTIRLNADHTIRGHPGARWDLERHTLTLAWPDSTAKDTLLLSDDATSYVGRNQAHVLIRGTRDTREPGQP